MNDEQVEKYLESLGIEGREEEENRVKEIYFDNLKCANTILVLDQIMREMNSHNFSTGLTMGVKLTQKYPEVSEEYIKLIGDGASVLTLTNNEDIFAFYDTMVELFAKSWKDSSD